MQFFSCLFIYSVVSPWLTTKNVPDTEFVVFFQFFCPFYTNLKASKRTKNPQLTKKPQANQK